MILNEFQKTLDNLALSSNLRHLPIAINEGKYVKLNDKIMLNLTSNDYLGLGGNVELRKDFIKSFDLEKNGFTSSSSRLLSGKFEIYDELESLLCALYHTETALVFNSGYHANIGILPAIADKQTLIIADKLVHASIIDGILLSRCQFLRYNHNNYDHLLNIIESNYKEYDKIIIVSESIFSMDGDRADLTKIIEIKHKYPNILLYLDEAHAVGVFGKNGLGLAEEYNCLSEIDLIVGTFGKAIASVGAFVVCKKLIRDLLINKMRSFIFSTALPPINIAWTFYVMSNLKKYSDRRNKLQNISNYFCRELNIKGFKNNSKSQIIPIILKDNNITLEKSEELLRNNMYVLAVRPPTVPVGTSRLRFSLNSNITIEDINKILKFF